MANITKPYFTSSDMVIVEKSFKKIGRELKRRNVDVKSIPGWKPGGGNGTGPWLSIVKRGWRQG